MTENYLIILKCEIDISDSTNNFKSNTRIIIHMIPINRLKINNCARRRLEITFQDIKSFYKLIPSERYEWSQWRRLVDREAPCSFPSRCVLIPFGRLETEVQQYLRSEKFLQPIQLDMSYDVDNISHKEAKPLFADVLEARNYSGSDNLLHIEKGLKSTRYIKGYYSSHLSKKHKSHQSTRLINRFGEGIPEGCLHGLYLRGDASSVEDLGYPSKFINGSQWSEPDKSYNISAQKMALTYILKLEQNIKNERRKEQTLIQTPMVKLTEHFNDKAKDNLHMEIHHTLKTARCFRISSSLFFPNRIRKSCSIDSLPMIDTYNHEYSYLTANLSLPSLDDVDFSKRTHRLTYSTNFSDEVTQDDSTISFWIPKNERFHQGRIFIATPVGQKYEAMQWR